jgi:hypothetical protein
MLDRTVHRVLDGPQVHRIDHVLGTEATKSSSRCAVDEPLLLADRPRLIRYEQGS